MKNPNITFTRGTAILSGLNNLPDGDYELVPKGTYRKTDVKFLLANSEGLDKKAVKALDKNGIGNLKELYGLTEEEIRKKAGLIKTTQTFEALLKLLKRFEIYYIDEGGLDSKKGESRLHTNNGDIVINSDIRKFNGNYIISQKDDTYNHLDIEWLLKNNKVSGNLKRAVGQLQIAEYTNLSQLSRMRFSQILKINGIGQEGLDALYNFLKESQVYIEDDLGDDLED